MARYKTWSVLLSVMVYASSGCSHEGPPAPAFLPGLPLASEPPRPTIAILEPGEPTVVKPLKKLACCVEISVAEGDTPPSWVEISLKAGKSARVLGLLEPSAHVDNRFTFRGKLRASEKAGEYQLNANVFYQVEMHGSGELHDETNHVIRRVIFAEAGPAVRVK